MLVFQMLLEAYSLCRHILHCIYVYATIHVHTYAALYLYACRKVHRKCILHISATTVAMEDIEIMFL